MHTHCDFISTFENISKAPSKAAKGRITKKTVPWEWFHLLLENVIPNLVNLWTRQFKEEIAQETMAAVQHIPAAFIQVLGNIATNHLQFTADSWCFWFFVLMKLMLQFHLMEKEVGNIEVQLQKWVQKYEKYYYWYHIEHLPACTLTIHGLLHVAKGIHYCGPAWTMWSFFMESNLNNTLLHSVILKQLSVCYDVSAELAVTHQRYDGPTAFEHVFEGYPNHIIHPPFKRVTQQDPSLQQKITQYSKVKVHLPLPTLFSGKLQIHGGGNFFQTAAVSHRPAAPARRNCYIKYKVILKACNHHLVQVIRYGDLEKIFMLTLPPNKFFTSLSSKTLVLALITPWNTKGKDTTSKNTYLLSHCATIVTNVQSLKAVVGLVPVGKWWSFVDMGTWEGTPEENESDMEDVDELFYT
ncbi:hypothetical protein BKA82DRAFT_4125839 [Pisolithus tinctorius]|nr:hypothetical protein BKA82DRAFT_4125839 [Pisolithus tinctorius]